MLAPEAPQNLPIPALEPTKTLAKNIYSGAEGAGTQENSICWRRRRRAIGIFRRWSHTNACKNYILRRRHAGKIVYVGAEGAEPRQNQARPGKWAGGHVQNSKPPQPSQTGFGHPSHWQNGHLQNSIPPTLTNRQRAPLVQGGVIIMRCRVHKTITT